MREKLKFRGKFLGGARRVGWRALHRTRRITFAIALGAEGKAGDSGKFISVEIEVEAFSHLMIIITWASHAVGKRIIWQNGNGGEEGLRGGGHVKREKA